jgi:hypothetical protein
LDVSRVVLAALRLRLVQKQKVSDSPDFAGIRLCENHAKHQGTFQCLNGPTTTSLLGFGNSPGCPVTVLRGWVI